MLTVPIVIYGVMRYLQLVYEQNKGESPEMGVVRKIKAETGLNIEVEKFLLVDDQILFIESLKTVLETLADDIRIIDTHGASFTVTACVLKAVEMLKKGESADKIVTKICCLLFIVYLLL